MKILYFDTETTGLDYKIHEVVQFSAIVEIDGEVKEEFNLYIQPTKWDIVSPEAIAKTGFTIEKMKEFTPSKEAYEQIVDFFEAHVDRYDREDKFFPAGHNIQFDINFLQSFFNRFSPYGTGAYQNWKQLDSLILSNFLYVNGKLPRLANHKLETLCEHFEIPLKAHDSLQDIRATRLLFKKLLAL